MSASSEVTLRTGSAADLEALAPLWVSVHHQHQLAMPQLAPYVSDEQSWRERHALYQSLFERYPTRLLLASAAEHLIGYGLAYVMPVGDSWLADTWRSGAEIGEIESLAVQPEHRGLGVGTRLLNGLQGWLEDQGVHDVVLGVLPGNAEAIRLYQRHGFTPTWMYLSRLAKRDGPEPTE